jgi:transposase-like protein
VSRRIQRQEVVDCAESGYSMRDTAEELGVSYFAICRFVKRNDLCDLFRHGNTKAQLLQRSRIDDPA